MNGTYITGFGKYFPGEPVSNEQMEGRLGKIGGKPSRARHRVLAQNGIKTRYYALDDAQETTVSNSEMAAGAVRDLLQNTECPVDAVGFLAAATTQGDLPVPGFASMVHGELELPAVEIATLHGVCCSGLMALKAAALQVSSGEHDAAVACASELPSRLFKAERYAGQDVLRESSLPFDTEFLRWMLSDGAGAALVQNRANPSGLSLRIDWIQIRSHADRYPLCMYAGANKDSGGAIGKGWLDYPSFEAAARDGALNLKQDIRLLDDVVKLGVNGLFELIESGKVDPDRLDWIVCHYSSEFFKSRIFELLELGGVRLPAERWFSNLTSKGNVGSASTFVLLEELFNEGALSPGQELLLMIPESGRSTMGYAKLTVVGETEKKRLPAAPVDEPVSVPVLKLRDDPILQSLVRQLTQVWVEFEGDLQRVPILERLYRGHWTRADYQALLLNLRQQVVEGSRWIARAASSIDSAHSELRSLFVRHAKDEHRDFTMLERDYVSVGGDVKGIRSGEKNLGSEALNAWMFHRASQPNPFDLLGAMFIIEGLGSTMATQWASRIEEQLGVDSKALTFLRYHGAHDEDHFERLEYVLNSGLVDADLAGRIVKNAKVTARLYRLQLEELNRF